MYAGWADRKFGELAKPAVDCPAAERITFSTAPVPGSKKNTTSCRESFHETTICAGVCCRTAAGVQ